MDNWINPYHVGHQQTRSKKRNPIRHVDGPLRNRKPQRWGCGRDPSSMRRIRQENPCKWKICSLEGTTKITRITHVLGQITVSTKRNDWDIQRRWWTYTMYNNWWCQRTRIMQKITKNKRRSDDHRQLSSQIGVINLMGKIGNWSPRPFGNYCWSQWHCTIICDPSELHTIPQR